MRHTSAARLHLISTTLPARGATRRYRAASYSARFQSTLPARGATACRCRANCGAYISIHAPRTGSDKRHLFPSCREPISIHAPRTGSDQMEEKTKTAGTDFNPRSPHGERRPAEWRTPMIYKFQSTLPARGATEMKLPNSSADLFQSTLPARGATRKRGSSAAASTFQSTLPARGATGRGKSGILYHLDFNPRSPHGERRNGRWHLPTARQISIHAPRTGSDLS